MKITAIGSFAFNAHGRPPADLDLVVRAEDRAEFEHSFGKATRSSDFKSMYSRGPTKMDVEWAYPNTSADVIVRNSTERRLIGNREVYIAHPEDLASCALSACSINIRPAKHLTTLLSLRKAGYGYNPGTLDLRLYEAALRIEYNPSRYFRSNKDFFKDSVKREMPHDQLHSEFMLGQRPCYMDMKTDIDSSHVDLDVFNKLTFDRKCECIWEEALVLGWERDRPFMVHGNLLDTAKDWLFRLGTNYLQMEFRPFLWWNFDHLMAHFPISKWANRL